MAEIEVNFVIDRLVPLLQEEAQLLRGVRTEANSILAELQVLKPFLRNLDERDARGELDEGVKEWVKQVRQVSHQIEDVIDEYMLHWAECPQRRGFIGFFYKVGHLIRKLKPRHDIASEIQDIKGTICEINERGNSYGFSSIDLQGSTSIGKNIPWHDPRLASLFIEEAEVVGIESPRNELISWLLEGSPKRGVISVVGMGGIGKTTLAKIVYDNPIVIAHFNCHAWISVSQTYKKKEVLKIMIKTLDKEQTESASEDMDKMDVTSLIEKLRDYLEGKRYVVVFDDVWASQFWGFIKNALPDKADKGSRVVITTRNDAVADSCKESPFYHVHKLHPLPPEMAWDLFCKKAFKTDFGGFCPPELTTLSQNIVQRCEGLPLAIVTIGGVLSTKEKVTQQWQRFHNSLGSELGSNPRLTGIKRILSLSYFDLPYCLKLCYLYFGIFPEDFSISCARLIRLWIAEGLVQRNAGKTLEEVAEEYLTDLIDRSLVQVSQVDFDGKPRRCRVHDMMREIILLISKDLGFCDILSKDNPGFESSDGLELRRLSIHNSEDKVLKSIRGSKIRSVFSFKANELPEPFFGILFSNFKLLKTLDFENAPLHYLHEEVGNLFHLRYLSIRRTETKVLPKSIGRLQNLLTLDLKRSFVYELPVEINRLHNLRHLLIYYFKTIELGFGSTQGVKIHEGFGCLEALQKLYYVEANHGPWVFEGLRKLTQLRKLGITKLKREDGEALCTVIEKMDHLESLSVWSLRRNEILDLQRIASAPKYLRFLYLKGRLEKFPVWISRLKNLVRVRFRWSRLTEDPLPFLQALPRLSELGLYGAYDGELLHFKEGGFQKLKKLELHDYNAELNSVIIDNGALPFLQELVIEDAPQLKEVPSGIQHLSNLTSLGFYDITQELARKMQPNEGQDYGVVKHIPRVHINVAPSWSVIMSDDK
ncbi:Disease resistance protein [Actinidia chinensis var. chinensis]|uniref:Disease resistance protein n=1 Tax=Actinidia chinensis var. chinensis TaxID=1590841 RepID=A0A2R6RBL3_ACTCC|nr:Disease resistance protein [Actinidia chinensis var. chinensis]